MHTHFDSSVSACQNVRHFVAGNPGVKKNVEEKKLMNFWWQWKSAQLFWKFFSVSCKMKLDNNVPASTRSIHSANKNAYVYQKIYIGLIFKLILHYFYSCLLIMQSEGFHCDFSIYSYKVLWSHKNWMY